LVSARSASILVILGIGLLTNKIGVPEFSKVPIIAFAGIFDTGGNVFFALATRFGRLDVSAVLGSLYPAVTVLLAWILLKERLSLWQWVGVMLVMVALILIAI
jgi:drug/metabolite transporter (DMT)-like permease